MRFKIFKKISLTVLLLLIIFFNTASAEEKKYPPYPDVWGYELPSDSPSIMVKIAKMPDGDYMITYVKKRIEAERVENIDYKLAGISFFSGISKDFEKDELGKFWKKMKEEKWEVKLYPPPPVIFSDGSIIERGGWWEGNCSNPFESYLQKKDKAGKVIAQKMLLYLYDEPVKESINTTCERNWDYKKDYYFKKVANMHVQFVPLEDDTFLVLSTGPKSVVIIRFDKDFNTKSDLIGKNIFLLDYKTFGDIAWKLGINEQSVNDSVSEYLINLKKGGK